MLCAERSQWNKKEKSCLTAGATRLKLAKQKRVCCVLCAKARRHRNCQDVSTCTVSSRHAVKSGILDRSALCPRRDPLSRSSSSRKRDEISNQKRDSQIRGPVEQGLHNTRGGAGADPVKVQSQSEKQNSKEVKDDKPQMVKLRLIRLTRDDGADPASRQEGRRAVRRGGR